MKKYILFLLCAVMPCAGFSMADHTPPVYGVPTLYGEYEVSSDDVRRANQMYGDVPVARTGAKPRAIRIDAPANKKSTAKHVKQQKKAMKKKSAKKKSVPVAKKQVARAGQEMPVTVPYAKEGVEKTVDSSKTKKVRIVAVKSFTPGAVVVPPVEPNPIAADIAHQATYKLDVDAYCMTPDFAPRGKMPDGFVLMPGRPDLMSCVPAKPKK